MKLVSQYDDTNLYQRYRLEDESHALVSEALQAQKHLANAVYGISLLIEDAYDLSDLDQAESELQDALSRLEKLRSLRLALKEK